MSTPVIITFGTLRSGFCPSTPQDLVKELYWITTAQTQDGRPVKINYAVFLPGFCNPTAAQFIEELNKIVSGFVVEGNAPVHVEFGPGAATFCWNQPQTVVDALAANYTAYVEE